MINFKVFSTDTTQNEALYKEARFNVISQVEENGELKPLPYVDSEGIPTIGIGLNLQVESVRREVISKIFNSEQDPDNEKQYTDKIRGILLQTYPKTTDSKVKAQQDLDLQTRLNAVMAERAADSRVSVNNKRSSFSFANTEEIKEVFETLAQNYEDEVNDRVGSIATVPYSSERLALFSLTYNNPSLLGDNLCNAIKDGNHPEAWYQIRYQTNGGKSKSKGIAKRRYYESQLFGLYNEPDNVSEEEAKSVFAIYTKHRGKIKDYDNLYPAQIEKANIDFNYKVENFPEATAKAKQVLINKYAPGKSSEIDEILVDLEGNGINRETNKKTSNALILGSSKDDIIRTGKGSNVLYATSGQDSIFSSAGSVSNELHGGAAGDIYYISSSSQDSKIIDDIYYNSIAIDGIKIQGDAKLKKNANGEVIDGIWTIDQGYDLHKVGNDLVIIKSGSDISNSALFRATIKDYDFNAKTAPFGINLNGKFLEYDEAISYKRQDKYPNGNLFAILYPQVFPANDPRGSFLSFLMTQSNSGKYNYAVQKLNERAETQSINFLTDISTTQVSGKFIEERLGAGTVDFCKLTNGNIAFIYTIDELHLNSAGVISKGSASSAFLMMLDSDGNIISNKKVHQIAIDNIHQYDPRKIIPSFVSENGMCFVSSNQNFCGTLDAETLTQTSNRNLYQSSTEQVRNIAILANNYRVETRTLGIPSHGFSYYFYIQTPIYAEITPEDVIPNYDIVGNQQTNSNLNQAIITLSQEEETNLNILPNPNSYLIIRGLNNNEKAKIDILDSANEAKIYSIDSSQYSTNDILAGKFKPKYNPLSLADSIYQRRLVENNSFNATDDYYGYNDNNGYYYSDNTNSTNDDNNSWQEFAIDGKYYSTLMSLPNNQTILLSGVNATELIKNPQNYFVQQEIEAKLPTSQPSTQPSKQPSKQPLGQPTIQPSSQPTHHPIAGDLIMPTSQPSSQPTSKPFANPSVIPSYKPIVIPSFQSTSNPASQLSTQPSEKPTIQPSSQTSTQQSSYPTHHPTAGDLSTYPTSSPSETPTLHPSQSPSFKPQVIPSFKPSRSDIEESETPTIFPSNEEVLTNQPTNLRTYKPTSFLTFLATEGLTQLGTQAQTFNSTFNQSLPQPPKIPNQDSLSFIQKPEGIVTVVAAALLVVGGLKWIFRKGESRIEPETRVEPREMSRVDRNEYEIERG